MCRRSCQAIACWVLLAIVGLPQVGADEPYGRGQLDEGSRAHWSYQELTRPEVPAAADQSWVRNPIDNFILAGLRKAGLEPAPPAQRATLLRRVYFDLIGLPPTPEEVAAFVADQCPTALADVVDDLLSRPQYGERWARHWLDVVRYAETNGYERDGQKPQAWRFRDWVIGALNADMPYDQFVVQQLAGDEVPGSNVNTQLATTMLRLGPWDDEPADPLADRYDQLDDIIATTSAAFMGLTLRCARCHDHKFEPLSQKDYTRWQAIFAPLKRPQKDRTEFDRDLGPHAEVLAYQARVKELNDRRGGLQNQIATLESAIGKRARSEGRLPTGSEGANVYAVLPMAKDIAPAVFVALALPPAERKDPDKQLLATHADKLKPITRELATAEERQQFAQWEQEVEQVKAQMPAPLTKGYVWYEESPQFGPSHVFHRGDPRNPGDEVNPGFPAVLVNQPPPAAVPTEHSSGRRLQLAHWLTQPNHPLTARVMINRVWQHHFGEGIVATENDFGVMGAPPSNQALLDWLASEFVAGGWQLKRMHRMIVLSQTYQMASTPNPKAERIDPHGERMWRFRPQRIEAETLRDAILSVSGQLNLSGGGPGVYPKISRAVLETQSRPGDGWGKSSPAESSRRSIYVYVKRTLLVPELEVLDFPNTEEACEQRVVSTVAPQALTFLNGEFIHEQAEAFAKRLMHEAGPDDAARVQRAYQLAYARSAEPRELQAVLGFLEKQRAQIAADLPSGTTDENLVRAKALSNLCLVLLNTNEFAYVQ